MTNSKPGLLTRINENLDRIIGIVEPVAYFLAWVAGIMMAIGSLLGFTFPIQDAMVNDPRAMVFAIGIILWTIAPDAYRYTKVADEYR